MSVIVIFVFGPPGRTYHSLLFGHHGSVTSALIGSTLARYRVNFDLFFRSAKLQTHLVNGTNEQNNKHNQNVQSDTVNESEKQSLTQKIENLKSDMDQKRLAIKNIKMSLEQLDVTE